MVGNVPRPPFTDEALLQIRFSKWPRLCPPLWVDTAEKALPCPTRTYSPAGRTGKHKTDYALRSGKSLLQST